MLLCQGHENQVETDRQVVIFITYISISCCHNTSDFSLIHRLFGIDQKVHTAGLDLHDHQLFALAGDQIQLVVMPMPVLLQDQIAILFQELASNALTLTPNFKCG